MYRPAPGPGPWRWYGRWGPKPDIVALAASGTVLNCWGVEMPPTEGKSPPIAVAHYVTAIRHGPTWARM